MKRFILLSIACLIAGSAFTQDIEFQININTPKLQTTDPRVFESLANSIRDFVDNINWSDDIFEAEERIKCNVQLTIREELSSNTFSADMAIQAVRPVYGSSYETILLSHVDKDVSFRYEEFQPLIYSRNSYQDNLSSIIAFYINIILGMDYDTFSPFGGESFFQTANEILNVVPPAATQLFPGWRSLDGRRNRYWIIENILSPKFRTYRSAMYDYHRQGLDIMNEDQNTGRAVILQSLEAISAVNRSYPNSMLIQMFANAKSSEVIEIFKNGTRDEKTKVRSIMSRIDAPNASRYRSEIGR
jgi:Domain of unknown function (DUF4835)